MSLSKAVEHLDAAEATILSWWQRLDNAEDEDDDFTTFSMLAAVLRSVARAAGHIEAVSDLDDQATDGIMKE